MHFRKSAGIYSHKKHILTRNGAALFNVVQISVCSLCWREVLVHASQVVVNYRGFIWYIRTRLMDCIMVFYRRDSLFSILPTVDSNCKCTTGEGEEKVKRTQRDSGRVGSVTANQSEGARHALHSSYTGRTRCYRTICAQELNQPGNRHASWPKPYNRFQRTAP